MFNIENVGMFLIVFVIFCAISSVEMKENDNIDTKEEILRKTLDIKEEKVKLNGNGQRVEQVIINEKEITYKDLVKMILENIKIEMHKHKKHRNFKNQMKTLFCQKQERMFRKWLREDRNISTRSTRSL
jgi:hypothetical protein